MSVYFARVGEYVKIGYSKDPRGRIRRLRCNDTIRPADLDESAPFELVAVIDGGRDTELILHRVLAGLRECGEWFRIPEPMKWPEPLESSEPPPGDHLAAEAMSKVFAGMPALQEYLDKHSNEPKTEQAPKRRRRRAW